MSGHVFVSYAHRADRAYVERLRAHLTESGVTVWFDAEIVTGERWHEVIRHRIDTCAAVVVVMSPEAESSAWVNREISYAEHLGKPVLPLLLSGLPFFRLSDMHYEDLTGGRMPDTAFVSRLGGQPPVASHSPMAPAPPGLGFRWGGARRRFLLGLGVAVCAGAAALLVPGLLLRSTGDLRPLWPGTRPTLSTGSPSLTPTTDLPSASAGGPTSPAAPMHTTAVKLTKRLTGLDRVAAVAFVPGRPLMVTGSNDETVKLWDVTVAAHPVLRWSRTTPDAQSVASVAISPDGRTLAVGSNADLILWNITDVTNPVLLTMLPTGSGAQPPLSAVEFSPKAPILATSAAGAVSLWNVADPAHPRRLSTVPAHEFVVNDLAFSPDGRTLVDVSGDNRGFVWDIADPAAPTRTTTLNANNGSMEGAAFRHDGQVMVTASMDGRVIVWQVVGPGLVSELGAIPNERAGARSVVFRSDNLLAIGRDDATVSLWNLSDPSRPTRWTVLHDTAGVVAVTFSPDGHILASSTGNNGKLSLWTLA